MLSATSGLLLSSKTHDFLGTAGRTDVDGTCRGVDGLRIDPTKLR
jgi:hypothetical protein